MESCSAIGPMVRLAEVTVGCRDRPEMGWMRTPAGTAPSAVGEPLCGAEPGSPASG